MKKIVLYSAALVLAVLLMGCSVKENSKLSSEINNQIGEQMQNYSSQEEVITNLVKDFGSKLKLVSILSPKETLEKDMRENYGDFVSEKLIEKWLSNPESALGRFTSSPWPDRIDIENIEKVSEEEYKVQGKIIEVTSNEKDGNIKREITLSIRKIETKWLIDEVVVGEYDY